MFAFFLAGRVNGVLRDASPIGTIPQGPRTQDWTRTPTDELSARPCRKVAMHGRPFNVVPSYDEFDDLLARARFGDLDARGRILNQFWLALLHEARRNFPADLQAKGG